MAPLNYALVCAASRESSLILEHCPAL
jgi:hypothetical protein